MYQGEGRTGISQDPRARVAGLPSWMKARVSYGGRRDIDCSRPGDVLKGKTGLLSGSG
jgi:hypothetical protein